MSALRLLRRNPAALASLIFLFGIVVLGLLGPLLSPYSPEEIDLVNLFAGPSAAHLLGTDENGRDLWTRLLYGMRVSLSIGAAAATIAILVGTLLGAVAGYFGGARDTILMRITDGFLSVPIFFLLLTVLTLFGSTLLNIVVIIGVTSWMTVARVVRGEVLRTRELTFVEAARCSGARDARILLRHVLPQAMPSIIVAATLGVAYAVLMETGLSYLGLGVQPPAASLGNLLTASQNYLWAAPQLAIYPGLIIFVAVLALNTLGNGLRDALDPLQRRR